MENILKEIREVLFVTTNKLYTEKINIFDFDGTIVKSPEPDAGRLIYKEKTGVEWPHKGWWGKNESLDMDIFHIPTISSTIESIQKAKAESNALTIMLTGRMPKNGPAVEKILKHYDISFDAYVYKLGNDTLTFKLAVMSDLVKSFTKVKEIELWEDRQSHFEAFENWGKEQEQIKFILNKVG